MDKEQLEAQMHKAYKMSAVFFGAGWGLIGIAVILLVLGFLQMGFVNVSFMSLTPLFFIGGIVMFILDGAIWKRKANNCINQLSKLN